MTTWWSTINNDLVGIFNLETADSEYQEALDSIQELRVSHEETHKLAWEVFKRSREVMQLQQALGDFQNAVFEERKRTLQIVAENDQLKSMSV
jgi:hypothetical protein